MKATNYQVFEQHGIEVVIDTTNGKTYMTQGMIARLVGKHSTVIARHFQKCKVSNHIELKSAQVQTRGGLQGVTIFDESYIILAIAKYAPDLLPKLTQAGLRVFLHKLVGFNYRVESTQQEAATNTKPKALMAAEYVGEIQKILGADNPRLAQYLSDHCINETLGQGLLGNQDDKSINHPVVSGYLGVVEIAENMGYSCTLSNRSSLGKYVKANVGHMAKQEKRLCNGTLRNICVYPDCELVRQTVASFFHRSTQTD